MTNFSNNDYADEPQYTQSAPVQNARVIDARNEQEFPSLGGAGASSGVTLVPGATMSIRAKAFGPAGLARTKENFPALGNSGNSKSDTGKLFCYRHMSASNGNFGLLFRSIFTK